jgi:WD40 repeat protein
MAFSPNGKRIVTTSFDFDIKVWDAESGLSTVISEHSSWVVNVSFAPDSNTFATCGFDSHVMIWQTESLECLQTIPIYRPVVLAHSPLDGRLLAAGREDGFVCVWNIADIKQPKILLNAQVDAVSQYTDCFSQLGLSMDGKYVAVLVERRGLVYVWDIEASAMKVRIQGNIEGSLFFSKDNTRLVTVQPEVKIWSIETGQLLEVLSDSVARHTCSPVRGGYAHSLDPHLFDVSRFAQQDVVFTALSPLSFSDGWILDRKGRKLFKYTRGRTGYSVSWGQKIAFGGTDGVVAIIHVPDEDTSDTQNESSGMSLQSP